MSEDCLSLPNYKLDELLATLKPYQAQAIFELRSNHGDVDVAKLWLSANGPTQTQHFGGTAPLDSKPFWDRFVSELRLFICGDKKYKKDRDKLLAAGQPAALIVVSSISGLLGAELGFAQSLLAPPVAMMLFVIGKVGVNAWCNPPS